MKDYKKFFAILFVAIITSCFASAAKKEFIILKQGDPLIIQQEKKTATFEIDYSKTMVVYGKKNEEEASFRDWMIMQDEDDEDWIKDWERKDSAEVSKTFRECFSDNIKKAMKLTKTGKDYKVILRIYRLSLGTTTSAGSVILFGGAAAQAAVISGEIEIQDLKTGETVLILEYDDVVGDGHYRIMARFRNVIDNLCNRIDEYLKDYKKKIAKEQKKQKK